MRALPWGRLSLASTSLAITALSSTALAADHAEAPGTAADPAADIADFYAWAENGKLMAIVTYGGVGAASPSFYDGEVLYGIHVDTDGDYVADQDIWLQLGQNDAGEWGVRAIHGDTTVEGAVESTLGEDDLRVWAGIRDDPFFFDLQGFQDTLSTAAVSFDPTRDSLAGLNVMALAVTVDLDTIDAPGAFRVWATSARK